jgi:hypothetical protein
MLTTKDNHEFVRFGPVVSLIALDDGVPSVSVVVRKDFIDAVFGDRRGRVHRLEQEGSRLCVCPT